MPTFNSKQYDWSNVEVWLLGKKITGIRGVSYTIAKEKEAIYGAGSLPQGIGHGNKSFEGELTLLQSEVEALTAKALEVGGDDITDLNGVNIIVMYAPKSGVKTIDVIEHAEFNSLQKGMNQNDKFAEISLPFIALNIKKGV